MWPCTRVWDWVGRPLDASGTEGRWALPGWTRGAADVGGNSEVSTAHFFNHAGERMKQVGTGQLQRLQIVPPSQAQAMRDEQAQPAYPIVTGHRTPPYLRVTLAVIVGAFLVVSQRLEAGAPESHEPSPRDGKECPEMVAIKPGGFQMGSLYFEPGHRGRFTKCAFGTPSRSASTPSPAASGADTRMRPAARRTARTAAPGRSRVPPGRQLSRA
jgi:hypothetical protein